MTEWIDFTVYAFLIVALWFLFPTSSSRFTIPYVSDRNPDWLSAHPDVERRLRRRGWYLGLSYAWGALSLIVLLAFQVGLWPELFAFAAANTPKWEALKELNSFLVVPGMVIFVVAGVLFARWIENTVPLAERRRAALERRSIDDYVPRWLRLATYGVVGAVLLAWLVVAVLQLYSTPKFWGHFAFLAALTPIFACFVRLAVNRPPSVLDRIFGPGFRVREIRIGFAMHLIPPLNGVMWLYEEVADVVLVDVNRAMHLGVVLIVASWALTYALSSPGPDSEDQARSSPVRWPVASPK